MENKRRTFFRRLAVWVAGAIYLLAVVGATVYSQTGYIESLPLVTLAMVDGYSVPNEAIVDLPDGSRVLNYVEQENGPWGKRYILRQRQMTSRRKADENHTLAYDMNEFYWPVATSVSGDLYLDGIEVRLS